MAVDPTSRSANPDQLPEIPGYTLQKAIGSGAMASVYLAIQDSLQRRVALKIMSPSLAADDSFCKRFLKEGKIIGRLNHPHIITIYDIGEYQGRYYMAMEYVGGGTLKERIKARMPPDRAASILGEVAGALGYAHKRGFVHRDVKPANILFRDDATAVLSDFGIAKSFVDSNTQMTAAGWTLGTPNYMSPEQALGKTVDARSDLYALGVVFYEMLVGKRPFEAKDAISTALMHVNDPVPRLPQEMAAYQGVIDKLLAKNPAERFASAEEVMETVGKTRAAQKAAAPAVAPTRVVTVPRKRPPPQPAPPQRAWPDFLRDPWWLVVPLVLLLALLLYWWLPASPPTPPVPTPRHEQPGTRAGGEDDAKTQIADLLRVANGHFSAGLLISPRTVNAAYGYCEVLKLDPKNEAALAGLQNVASAYPQKLEANNTELGYGLLLIEDCLRDAPEHAGLLALRERIRRQLGGD